jgi:hypothetical protein
MSNNQISAENFINVWTGLYLAFFITITIILSFFGFDYALAFVGASNLYITVFLTIAYTLLLILLRKKWFIKIFNHTSHLTFLIYMSLIEDVITVLTLIIFLIFDVLMCSAILVPEIFAILEPYSYIIGSFPLFFLLPPLNMAFSKVLTKTGKTKIEFEQVFSNLDDFSERQIWAGRVFRKLENLLTEGNILVPRDKLTYYLNLRLAESESTKDTLRKIEKWMLSERRDNSILSSLMEIIPKEEIKPLQRTLIRSYLAKIPQEWVKYLFITLIILLILVKNPELLERVLQGFFSL